MKYVHVVREVIENEAKIVETISRAEKAKTGL